MAFDEPSGPAATSTARARAHGLTFSGSEGPVDPTWDQGDGTSRVSDDNRLRVSE